MNMTPSHLKITQAAHDTSNCSKTVVSSLPLGQQRATANALSSQRKIETLDQLKTAYFAKMQSLNKKLENERELHK